MGNTSSEKITENQQILTEVTQISEQFCNIGCNQNIDGTTIISINQVGDINVTQMCQLLDIQCVMKSTMDTQIDSILEAINNQSTTQTTTDFWQLPSSSKETLDITQLISNQITQIQIASCNIEANQEMSNTYIYSANQVGDIYQERRVI